MQIRPSGFPGVQIKGGFALNMTPSHVGNRFPGKLTRPLDAGIGLPQSKARQIQVVEKKTDQSRNDDPNGNRPPDELSVAPPIGTAHARQEVIPVFFFILSRPEHSGEHVSFFA